MTIIISNDMLLAAYAANSSGPPSEEMAKLILEVAKSILRYRRRQSFDFDSMVVAGANHCLKHLRKFDSFTHPDGTPSTNLFAFLTHHVLTGAKNYILHERHKNGSI